MNRGRTGAPGAGRRSRAIIQRLPLVLALIALVVTATQLYAHLALQRSTPTAGDRLDAVPEAITLRFTEPVELALSTVSLTGPAGQPVGLAALRADESRQEIAAQITEPLEAGRYTVTWQAVGRDGHPVRGEFGFDIEEDAEGLAIPVEETPQPVMTERIPVPSAPVAPPVFGPQSPLYAGVRWLNYLGILGALGAIGFSLLLSSSRTAALPESFRATAGSRAAGMGVLATILLAATLPLRLNAQSHALFGGGITTERFGLILDSGWGSAWLLQAVTTLIVLAGLVVAQRARRVGWLIALLGALGLVVTPGLSGHAAAVEPLGVLAVGIDAAHVVGVGVWLGTLLVIVSVGLPLLRGESERQRGESLAHLILAFSPMALVAGGTVIATGAVASLVHLTALSDLWATGYGRLLGVKLVVVAIVLATGALNWRRIGPACNSPGGDRRLARSAGVELTAAMIIVALTAVLVAVPLPGEAGLTMQNPQEATTQP